MQTLDQKMFRAVNGDGGGTWAPSSAITIGGAGMWLCALWLLQAGAFVGGGGFGIIWMGDNDYPVLYSGHTGASRTLHCDLMDVYAPPGSWILHASDATAQTAVLGANGIFPLRVHHGAQIVSVQFLFIVATHAGVPAVLPKVRVFSLEVATGIIKPLKTGATVDSNGYLMFNPTPVNAAAWNNAGLANGITYTLDGGTIADVGKYVYFGQVIDESGTNALVGTKWIDAAVLVNTIADLRFQ